MRDVGTPEDQPLSSRALSGESVCGVEPSKLQGPPAIPKTAMPSRDVHCHCTANERSRRSRLRPLTSCLHPRRIAATMHLASTPESGVDGPAKDVQRRRPFRWETNHAFKPREGTRAELACTSGAVTAGNVKPHSQDQEEACHERDAACAPPAAQPTKPPYLPAAALGTAAAAVRGGRKPARPASQYQAHCSPPPASSATPLARPSCNQEESPEQLSPPGKPPKHGAPQRHASTARSPPAATPMMTLP